MLPSDDQRLLVKVQVETVNIPAHSCLQNCIAVWLDKEFADELVCRTTAETDVSQVLSVDLELRAAILNNGNRRVDII